ncbi:MULTISPECIES: TRAP transporter large permease [Pseudomonas]|uniref:TRAP transporter large permease protein n=1 Tax=Pseudomonas luteola TaxID=47886 RepID=A0A2X2EU21_PSELU|nr:MULTISPECIES: TRAP transporter large permease subunit [Pseudomonas]AYN93298.1 TRAP transporter permease DctM [Pseudomonas sp. LTJR-52]ENA35115.1 TRAP transporter, DctM subunit [Pseudomonas sp. HPB0071]MBF8642559.1 TRAP transporter large permease subunit [Pseudomonas zeshuii]MBH3439844.1 TRAP transporter large permease subunit [Pseudomonas luteola]MDN3236203.1 TRAP transporter large permease subunit [Pseudomonas sp. WAC2]
MTVAVFLSSLLGFMAFGMPIAFALLLTGAVLMWYLDFWDVQLLAQNLQAGADSFPLLAVPFFILAGELMNAGGISRRIITMAQAFVGHKKGGLGYVAIAASVLLASMSGSALADTAALATLLLPMMRQRGYPLSSSCGLVSAGGIIAPIIPPSMPFVIYGVVTNTSISQLFLAGLVPGLIMGAGLIIAWTLIARSIHEPPQPKASWAERRHAIVDGIAALMLPVIIVGGLRGGIFTPTEAAVVAAVYALLVSTLLYRELSWNALVEVLTRASRTTASVMFLCAAATVSAYMVTLAQLPDEIAAMLGPIADNPKLLVAAIMLLMVAIGMVLDLTPTILILGPVLAPIAAKAGVDPVYFGVMFVLIGSIGLITPPVGTVLNVVGGIGRIRMEKLVQGVLPFFFTYIAIVVLLVIFPEIITVPLKWLH